jgi:uroporphyrinogen decarboxylase
MTSRERVLAAIAHRQPDRVPLDLGATPSSGISASAYHRFKKTAGHDELPTLVYDVVQQLAQPDIKILDAIGADVLDIGRVFNDQPSDWKPTTLPDGAPAFYPAWFNPHRELDGAWTAHLKDGTEIARMPAGAAFYDQTCFPFLDGYPASYENLGDAMNKILWSALVHSPWDNASRPDFWPQLRERTLKLRASTDRALMIVVGCNLFEWGTFLRRIDNFLMDLIEDEVSVERLLDALMEKHLAFLEKVCATVGDIVDVCRFGDDLGMDSGPFMRRETYRQLFKPRHAKLCAYVKTHSRMTTFLHSCGSIYELMPDLIEAGFEIFNPVQTACRDMDPARLKREFGPHITFWGGGCDTRHILNRGTSADVRANVLERMKIFAPGGGFVFNTVHNILPDVPPENIAAMYAAVREFNGS